DLALIDSGLFDGLRDGFFAQFDGGANPNVVRFTEAERGIFFDGQRKIAAPDAHVAVEQFELSRLWQPVAPVRYECVTELLLVIVVLRKRASRADNPHLAITSLSSSSRYRWLPGYSEASQVNFCFAPSRLLSLSSWIASRSRA